MPTKVTMKSLNLNRRCVNSGCRNEIDGLVSLVCLSVQEETLCCPITAPAYVKLQIKRKRRK